MKCGDRSWAQYLFDSRYCWGGAESSHDLSPCNVQRHDGGGVYAMNDNRKHSPHNLDDPKSHFPKDFYASPICYNGNDAEIHEQPVTDSLDLSPDMVAVAAVAAAAAVVVVVPPAEHTAVRIHHPRHIAVVAAAAAAGHIPALPFPRHIAGLPRTAVPDPPLGHPSGLAAAAASSALRKLAPQGSSRFAAGTHRRVGLVVVRADRLASL